MRLEKISNRFFTEAARRVRRILGRTSEAASQRLPVVEPIAATEENFPSRYYHYWRDALQYLQQGHSADAIETAILLTNETAESTSWIGMSANWLARDTIVGLREGRVDIDGQPHILCTDEISDKQVFADASLNERQAFLIRAIGRIPHTLWLADDERQRAYVIASVALAEVFLYQTPEVARETVNHAISLGNFRNSSDLGQRLHAILSEISQEPIDCLLMYISQSRQRLLAEEQAYIAKHGPREHGSFEEAYVEAGQTGKPLELLGRQLGVPQPYELQINETELFFPLSIAVHKSREEMITAAINLADRLYGLRADQMEVARTQLSQRWRDAENLEGVRSDELLIYIPANTTRISINEGPRCFYRPPGWYLYRVLYEDKSTRYIPKRLK